MTSLPKFPKSVSSPGSPWTWSLPGHRRPYRSPGRWSGRRCPPCRSAGRRPVRHRPCRRRPGPRARRCPAHRPGDRRCCRFEGRNGAESNSSPINSSSPGPPLRSSLPPSPQMMSLPGPPLMWSTPGLPTITSSPGVPLIFPGADDRRRDLLAVRTAHRRPLAPTLSTRRSLHTEAPRRRGPSPIDSYFSPFGPDAARPADGGIVPAADTRFKRCPAVPCRSPAALTRSARAACDPRRRRDRRPDRRRARRAGADVVLIMRPETLASYGGRLARRERRARRLRGRSAGRGAARSRVDVLWVDAEGTGAGVRTRPRAAGAVGEAVVIPFLNGVDHVALLRERYANVVAGAIRVESERAATAHIRQLSPFLLVDLSGAEDVAAELQAAGLDYARARRRALAPLGQARRPRAVRARDDGARRAARRRPRGRALSRLPGARSSRSPAPSAHTSTASCSAP